VTLQHLGAAGWLENYLTYEGSKKHHDNPVPNVDFLVLHCLGIGSSVLGIRLDHIGKYMSTI
jgi:hypothetical protein